MEEVEDGEIIEEYQEITTKLFIDREGYLPVDVRSYRRSYYWNERFQTEEKYDWFKSYKDFKHLITQDVKKTDRILMLGCGNSSLSEEMYKDGFHSITNVDFSSVVLKKMKIKNPEMDWVLMNIQRLQFKPNSFDIVIEKGTLDAFLVDEQDQWNPSMASRCTVVNILNKAFDTMTEHGKYISITFAQPHFRIPLMKSPKWNIQKKEFGDGFHYFYYVLSKKQPKEQ